MQFRLRLRVSLVIYSELPLLIDNTGCGDGGGGGSRCRLGGGAVGGGGAAS